MSVVSLLWLGLGLLALLVAWLAATTGPPSWERMCGVAQSFSDRAGATRLDASASKAPAFGGRLSPAAGVTRSCRLADLSREPGLPTSRGGFELETKCLAGTEPARQSGPAGGLHRLQTLPRPPQTTRCMWRQHARRIMGRSTAHELVEKYMATLTQRVIMISTI